MAADAGLQVLGSSNYYDFAVYARFAQSARSRGVFPLFGVEIISLVAELKTAGIKVNDPDNPGRMYLCGKGITRFAPMPAEAERLMQRIRDADLARIDVMIKRMTALMQDNGVVTAVSAASVQSTLARRYAVPASTVYLQERHVAQAFQEALFAQLGARERTGMLRRVLGVECAAPDDPVTVQNQIRSQLMKAGKPAYVEESVLDADMAYALVLALGGVPCYPILADGASPVCQFEESVDDLVDALVTRGIWCAEIIPGRNAPTTVDRYATELRGAGIIVLGGTEHNTLELAPITPECKGRVPVSDAWRSCSGRERAWWRRTSTCRRASKRATWTQGVTPTRASQRTIGVSVPWHDWVRWSSRRSADQTGIGAWQWNQRRRQEQQGPPSSEFLHTAMAVVR